MKNRTIIGIVCIVLALIAVALSITCVVQAVCYGERIHELEQLLGVITS